jgi:septal ring factor EnvC (AmiA/AmiB activator)
MNKEKAKAAFEKWRISRPLKFKECPVCSDLHHGYLAGAEWAWGECSDEWNKSIDLELEVEKLQTELNWHKKELARVDHALVDACDKANKLQADLKSVNFSYWKKCEELSQLQEQNKLQADLKSVNFSYWKKCEELSQLQEQNNKLRECLEFYADHKNGEEE